MTDKNLNKASIERRTFLKAATSSVGAAAVGVGSASGTKKPVYAQTLFAEIGVEHDVDLGETSSGYYPYLEVDKSLGHFVNEENNELYLMKSLPDGMLQTFKRGESVVRANNYRRLPTQLFDQLQGWIVTETGRSYRTLKALDPANEYRLPSIELQSRDEKIISSTSGNQNAVNAGETQTVSLPSQTVSVEVSESTGRKVERDDIPDSQKAVAMERWEETIQVEPKLKIKNYGTIDIVDFTDRRVVDP